MSKLKDMQLNLSKIQMSDEKYNEILKNCTAISGSLIDINSVTYNIINIKHLYDGTEKTVHTGSLAFVPIIKSEINKVAIKPLSNNVSGSLSPRQLYEKKVQEALKTGQIKRRCCGQ